MLLFAVCIHTIMYCLSKFILKIPHKHTMILYKFSLFIHNKIPQQCAAYHLVLIGLLSCVWPKLTTCAHIWIKSSTCPITQFLNLLENISYHIQICLVLLILLSRGPNRGSMSIITRRAMKKAKCKKFSN